MLWAAVHTIMTHALGVEMDSQPHMIVESENFASPPTPAPMVKMSHLSGVQVHHVVKIQIVLIAIFAIPTAKVARTACH